MIQVKKNYGSRYDINLDPHSMKCMKECRDKLLSKGDTKFSNSILVRAALRHYHEHLRSMMTSELEKAHKEALKASKGQA